MMIKLCAAADLAEGDCRGFECQGVNLLLLRTSGGLYLYQNRCPHRGINLEWMPDRFLDVERQYIQCATHGALFTLKEGYCVQGPCRGESLCAVPWVVENGDIWVAENDLDALKARL